MWLDCELQILFKNMFVLGVVILRYLVYNEQGEKGAVVGEREKKIIPFVSDIC